MREGLRSEQPGDVHDAAAVRAVEVLAAGLSVGGGRPGRALFAADPFQLMYEQASERRQNVRAMMAGR